MTNPFKVGDRVRCDREKFKGFNPNCYKVTDIPVVGVSGDHVRLEWTRATPPLAYPAGWFDYDRFTLIPPTFSLKFEDIDEAVEAATILAKHFNRAIPVCS